MELKIKLEVLRQENITPNEYVVINAIKSKCLDSLHWDYGMEIISLNKKGILKNKELVGNKEKKLYDWIYNWINLWPSKMLPGGYRISGNTSQCISKMKVFTRSFPQYNWEIITEATRRYLKDRENNNWQYVKKNAKFISDRDGSVLEQECEALLSGEDNNLKTNIIDL